MLVFITIFIILFIMELVYLKWAALNTIQNPLNNSGNRGKTIVRGAGIIIVPALLFFIAFFHQDIDTNLAYFIAASLMLAIVSFMDDLKPLSILARLLFHFIAITLIFVAFSFFDEVSTVSILLLLMAYILAMGYINISNFMDGINGMSFLNALVGFITFYIINSYLKPFTSPNLIIIFMLTILVFGYFNFRKKPKCFFGDVGSITFGFAVLFFTIKLYIQTKNIIVFLILISYALDGGWTILERLFKNENIFKSHTTHLYELLVYKLKKGHLNIALGYFLFQVFLNLVVCLAIKSNYKDITSFFIGFGLLSLLYFAIKWRVYITIKHCNE